MKPLAPLKQFRRGFLVLAGAATPVVGGGLLLAADPLFESGLRKYGPQTLRQPVAFAEADLSAFLGSARVDQLVIGPPEQPLVQAGHIGFSAAPLNFIRGRVRIDEAVLDDAVIHLVVGRDGKFSFDPGPPPPQTPKSREPKKRRRKELPAEPERDFVQIAAEYWDRLMQYKEYYDRIGALKGGEDVAEEDPERRRGGRASYLRGRQPPGSGFWLGEIGLENFRIETRDERTGKPLIPPVQSVTLKLENFGDAPAGFFGPAVLRAGAEFAGGGALRFHLELARDGGPNGLRFLARGLPVGEWLHLAAASLPWDIPRGTLDLEADHLRFTGDSLQGSVKLTLRGVRLRAKPDAPDVLGVRAAEFTRILNEGLEQGPIVLEIGLSGTPTAPDFAFLNARTPAELILNGLRREAEDRLRQELQEEGQQRLNELLGDRAPDLGPLLGNQPEPPKEPKRGQGKGKGGG